MEMWKESQLKQLTLADRINTAYPILLRFAQNIGFNFCAITIVANKQDKFGQLLQLNNFSEDWNHVYEDECHAEVDPVFEHCNDSMLPIVWSEQMFANAPTRWQALQEKEIRHGWSQAFHHADSGRRAILSLARKHSPISPLELYEHFGYLFYATSHLSELYTRSLPPAPPKPSQPRLSVRELEVLKLSAGGKTAYEIARILSLSERTVNYHVHNVIAKLDVCNKISAVIAAARAGII